jgi:predicted SnoaL-like aldol condensation-catalyzing enzyme
MEELTPERLAADYVAWAATGDRTMLKWFAPTFLDHVSGRGPEIWDVVAGWIAESFADVTVDLHAVMSDGDRVMVWITVHGRHVGSAFPRLRDLPALGNQTSWSQVHFFRVSDGLVTEHWAVRDDAALVDQVRAPN